jgi:hypothetical protein
MKGSATLVRVASQQKIGGACTSSHPPPHSAIAVANVDYQELLLFHQLHPSMVSGEEAHPKAERPNLRYPLPGLFY